MPTYNYECNKCEHLWEQYMTIADREKPTQEPCPKCKKAGGVCKSWKNCTPAVESDMMLTPDKATGGQWSELMNKMKAGAPPRLRHYYDRSNNVRARRWH